MGGVFIYLSLTLKLGKGAKKGEEQVNLRSCCNLAGLASGRNEREREKLQQR